LWLAEGFGVGRVPLAPGTFGSVVGVVWMLALAAAQNLWWYSLGLLAGLGLSVGLCAAAERRLGASDPASVVLDEIAALPLCFTGWIGYRLWLTGEMPSVEVMLSGRGWLLLLGGLVAFRLFDILKPWPVRQSQTLPGGWGVTIDDLLAAVYANVVWLPFAWLGWL
jgi:phosphatidylglycerophosphatase A